MPVNLFKSNKKRLLLAFLLLIGLAATSYISIRFYLYAKSLAINRLEVRKKKQAWEELEKNIRSLLVNFRGDCGIVIRDLKYGWEFSFNADKLIPSASLAKIPVMAACFYAQEEGAIDLNQLLSLKRKVRVLGSGRLKNMPYGTNFRAGDLIELMIAESDNTAANMLIELLG
ncbi:MAG: class A beta-lactamase-related serine hydrolase, partial [Candidatus Omnitrophica bacterium]|nr:class A beta-lactamase-related serine hydrolase [Candidatus Omnitrophota bacterium]